MGHSLGQLSKSHAFEDRDHFVGNLSGQEGVRWVVVVTAGLLSSCQGLLCRSVGSPFLEGNGGDEAPRLSTWNDRDSPIQRFSFSQHQKYYPG